MKVPCIICSNITECKNPKAIAHICDNCNKGNLNKILKSLDYKKIKRIIEQDDKQLKLTKDGELI